MMKRILVGIGILGLTLSLAACGHAKQSSTASSVPSQLNQQVSTLTHPFMSVTSSSIKMKQVITTPQQALQLVVDKYGNDHGNWQWGCLVSGNGNNQKYKWSNNQPVANDDPHGYFIVRSYPTGKSANNPINTYHVYSNGVIKLSN